MNTDTRQTAVAHTTSPVEERADFTSRSGQTYFPYEALNIEEVHQRFCSVEDLDLSCDLFIVQSNQGTGKTQLLAQLSRWAWALGLEVLSVNHRKALVSDLCSRLALESYLETDPSGDLEALGICLDSLPKLSMSRWSGYVLLLDEWTQLFKHLFGKTCSDKFDRVRKALAHLIRQADKIVFSDADISPEALAWVLSLRGEGQRVQHYINTFAIERELYRHPDKESLYADLGYKLHKGKRVVVASSSKDEIKALDAWIEDQFPELRLKMIHGDNSGSQENQAFLKDINGQLKAEEIDVFLYSPSLSTGVSIDLKGYFEAVYLLGVGGSLTHLDLLQALQRTRDAAEYHAYVVPCAPYRGSLVRAEREEAMLRTIHMTQVACLGDYGPDGTYEIQDEALFQMMVGFEHDRANSLANLAEKFYTRAQEIGFVLRDRPAYSKKERSEQIKAHKAEMKEAFKQAVLDTPTPEPERAEELSELPSLTEEERQELTRYAWVQSNGGEEELEDYANSDRPRVNRGVAQLLDLDEGHEVLVELDRLQPESETFLNSNHRALRAQVFEEIEQSYGGLWFEDELSAKDLDPFVEVVKRHASALQAIWGKALPKDLESKPISMLKWWFKTHGLELKRSSRRRVQRRLTRFYRPCPDKQALLAGILERRREARRKSVPPLVRQARENVAFRQWLCQNKGPQQGVRPATRQIPMRC